MKPQVNISGSYAKIAVLPSTNDGEPAGCAGALKTDNSWYVVVQFTISSSLWFNTQFLIIAGLLGWYGLALCLSK